LYDTIDPPFYLTVLGSSQGSFQWTLVVGSHWELSEAQNRVKTDTESNLQVSPQNPIYNSLQLLQKPV
jgi:hypothetical protein